MNLSPKQLAVLKWLAYAPDGAKTYQLQQARIKPVDLYAGYGHSPFSQNVKSVPIGDSVRHVLLRLERLKLVSSDAPKRGEFKTWTITPEGRAAYEQSAAASVSLRSAA